MRAVHVSAPGVPAVLIDMPIPEVSEGTVLIRVRAAGLNAIDNANAAGAMSEMLAHEYPLVLGRDAAGIVEAVGEGVDHVSVGDHVMGHMLLAPPIQAGTLAEYALLPAETVVSLPADLDFAAAAALPLAGAAAYACVTALDIQGGEVVLINGATGGVGSYVIQLRADRGASVIATGTPADAERLIVLGATEVIGFTAGLVADQVLDTHPSGVDALVELVAYAPDASPLTAVKPGGRVVSTTGHPTHEVLNTANLSGVTVMAPPVRGTTPPLVELAAAGKLSIEVSTVLPLEQASEGLATIAAGQARGKIVVTVGG